MVLRLLGRWQLRKMQTYEAAMLRTADGVSMMSEDDVAAAQELCADVAFRVVGAGTDLDRYRIPAARRQRDVIEHVGNLTAFTKLEPMVWFAREVLPRVRQVRPDVSLELVGGVPADAFHTFPGVKVIGRVPDDVPYLQRGRVFVAPQFVGSGVRLKLLNAMATGNAIVCTQVACEGLSLHDGEHALIRDDPEGMSAAILSILADDGLAMQLGENARRLAEARYGWRSIVGELEELLQDTAARRSERSSAKAPQSTWAKTVGLRWSAPTP
jgi:glycosyltransferase involved in cell wall biosynthesis